MEKIQKDKKLKIDINISGTSGSGKSVMSFLFWNALHQYGIPSNYPERDGSRLLANFGQNLHEAIIDIKKKTDIEINVTEKQMPRLSKDFFSNKEEEPAKPLELRMYSLVLYQLKPIQGGIQSGHANVEYGVKYGFTGRWLDWATNWKTVIVLNGGSSSTFSTAVEALIENDIEHCQFIEPDLYTKPLSVSFLVDERVFNKELYPDFKLASTSNINESPIEMAERYKIWVENIGGAKNLFLREWLKNFRLAD